jgi:hypothetical protein
VLAFGEEPGETRGSLGNRIGCGDANLIEAFGARPGDDEGFRGGRV